ncbi:PAS domain S-box protein, partial [Methanocalculus sp.]|uniref:response regulator n=1 Tax=Methanocalculus sp. TaxID=2004547 RepID=UPI00261C2E53
MSNPATDDQTISVIYVDDEPSLLEIGRLFLQKTGTFTVTTAESADEAIQTLQKQSFNAIISDYQMPGMDGIAFLKYLRTAGDTTPFIIFTGKGREDVVIEALNEGADFYLQKGGDPKSQFAELSNKVRYAVTRRQAEEALLLKNEELSAAEEELRSQLDETIAVQHQLALSEQQYRAIFEHTEAPTVIIEEDTTISLANSAFATISGYSMQEVIGRSWAEFVIKQDLDRMMVYHRERREEGVEPRTQYDFTFINRYGDPSTIHLTIGMIPGTRQSVASFHDITEMKLAESALKMSEIRYRRLFEAAQDGILILDEDDGAIIDANPFVLKMLGYCLDELLGRRLPEIGFIRDKILAEEAFLRLKGEGYIRYEDLPLETKDGRLMEVEFISNRYAINDHSVIQCNIRDVTERKRAESEILEAQRLLGGMLDGIPDIVGLQHPDHTMVRYNKAGYELLGLTPEEVEGRRCYELIGR